MRLISLIILLSLTIAPTSLGGCLIGGGEPFVALAENADAVVVARLVSSETMAGNRDWLETKSEFHVERWLTGKPTIELNRIYVVQSGGEIEDRVSLSSDFQSFATGALYTLCLVAGDGKDSPSSSSYYRLLGGCHGAHELNGVDDGIAAEGLVDFIMRRKLGEEAAIREPRDDAEARGWTRLSSDDDVPSRWTRQDSGRPIPYLVDVSVLPDGIDTETALRVTRQAFKEWEEISGIRFVFFGTEAFGAAVDKVAASDGIVRVQLHDHDGDLTRPVIGRGGINAERAGRMAGIGGMVKGQDFYLIESGWVQIDAEYEGHQIPVNLRRTLVHEIGHAIGLAHSSNDPDEADPRLREAAMYFLFSNDDRDTSISDYDRATVSMGYPAIGHPPYLQNGFIDLIMHREGYTLMNPDGQRYLVRGIDRDTPRTGLKVELDLASSIVPEAIVNGSKIEMFKIGVADSMLEYASVIRLGSDLCGGDPRVCRLDPGGNRSWGEQWVRVVDGENASGWSVIRVISVSREFQDNEQSIDGIPDNWIDEFFTDKISYTGATADPDHDGCTNFDEFLQRTHPLDSSSKMTLTVESRVTTVSEADGWILMNIKASLPTQRPLEIPFAVTGTARLEEDYVPVAMLGGVAHMYPGDSETTVAFQLIDDGELEDPETITFELLPTQFASLGESTAHTMTIEDNDGAARVYGDWAEANNIEGSPEKDDDGNGLPNIVEFVLDLPDTGGNSIAEQPVPVVEGGDVTWFLPLNKEAHEVGYRATAFVSYDSINWLVAGTPGSGVDVIQNDSNGIRLRLLGEEARLLRIEVHGPD
ncbi:MAG: matrixin family metalloprotease [Verrucomicrobiales bacterium]